MYFKEDEKTPEKITEISTQFTAYVAKFPNDWFPDAKKYVDEKTGIFDRISSEFSSGLASFEFITDSLEYTGHLRDVAENFYARLMFLTQYAINNQAEAHQRGITTEFLMNCILFLHERTVPEGSEKVKLTKLFIKICELHDKKTVFDLITSNQDFLLFVSYPFSSCNNGIFFDIDNESRKFRNKVEETLYIDNILVGIKRTLNFQYASQLAFIEDMEKPFNFSNLSELLSGQEKKAYALMKSCDPTKLYINLLQEIEHALNRKKLETIGQASYFHIDLDLVTKAMSLLLDGINDDPTKKRGCQRLFSLICESFDKNAVIKMIGGNPQFLDFICASERFLSIGKSGFQSCIENKLGIEIERPVFGEAYHIKILNPHAAIEPNIFDVVASQASLLGASMMNGLFSNVVPRRAPAAIPVNDNQDEELRSLKLSSDDEESSASLSSSS